MKYYYQFIIASLMMIILGTLSMSSSTKDSRLLAINYTLYKGEATVNRLVKEIEAKKVEMPNLNERNFYVTFSECDDKQEIVLEYCDNCDFKGLIKASNRFLILDQEYKVSVIFEGDKIHSNYVNNKEMNKPAPIIYDIKGGADIVDELIRGMNEYKALLPKLKLEDTDFYITYNECDDQRIAILGYCKGCVFKDLIGATNRYFVIDKDLKLPIVFESDRQHSNFFASPDGIRIFITSEGYMVVADKKNKILSKGFTQY